MRHARFALAVVMSSLLLAAVGCAQDEVDALAATAAPSEEGPDQIMFSPGDMTAGEQWSESAILAAPKGATRIGMLVDVSDPAAAPLIRDRIEVRGFTIAGKPMDWVRASVTWNEDRYLVARSDPGTTIFAAQLRLPAAFVSSVAHIAFSAVVPDEFEGVGSTLDETTGALTVSGLVQPRSAWQARPTKCTTKDAAKKRFAVHHTFTPPASGSSYEARIRSIQAYHMDTRGWCDIGYHFLVADDGRIFEGRPVGLLGAHVANNNSGNIGVSYVGCFQTGECDAIGFMQPSAKAITAGGQLIGALKDQFGIAATTATVKGHMQHPGASTSCPGDRLLSKLADIIAIANGAPPATPGTDTGEVPIDATPKPARVAGVVFDASITADPGAPGSKRLPGAIVSISATGGQSPQTQTVSTPDALWQFDVPAGEVTFLATAPGYLPSGRTVTVTPGADTWASIGLVPAQAAPTGGPATIRVRTTAGAAIGGAVLKAGGTWLLVDATGVATVPVDAAPVSVTAYAPGYQAASAQAKAGVTTDLVLPAETPILGSGVIQGVVWDLSKTASPNEAGAKRLSEAVVVCSCGRAAKGRLGDAYWAITAPLGTQTFTAIAPGYVAASQPALVTLGGSEWSSIGLVPIGSATPVPPPSEAPAPKSVCYPGPTGANDQCFQAVPKSAITSSDYAYPPGLGPQYLAPSYYLDLTTTPAGAAIAKNFVVSEFMEPSKGQWAVYSPRTVAHWQKIRTALGVPLAVNSGYRSPVWNAGVDGSASYSRHMWGDGADVTANGKVTLAKIKTACLNEGADYVKVYTTHVHCDWRDDPLDPTFFAFANKPGALAPAADDDAAPESAPTPHQADTSATVTASELTPAVGDAVVLEATWSGFDEGTPWIRWTITGPTGQVVREPATAVAFEAAAPGDYHIDWDVGGVVTGTLTVTAR